MNIAELLTKPVGPSRFQRRPKRERSRVVVCAGDSLTHGLMSANYVRMLMEELGPRGYEFVNAGISGDLAFNLLRRLDDVIACRPDVVTVLIGTNDAAAHIDEKWRQSYLRRQRLPQTPTLDWYRATLREIVERLKAETCAHIALLEIPPIGEDLESVHNQWVAQHNQAIHQVAAATGVRVLELHERLVALLPRRRPATPFDGSRKLMGSALVDRLLRRKSWNDISSKNNLTIFTDQIHLNEVSAREVVSLIGEYVVAAGRVLEASTCYSNCGSVASRSPCSIVHPAG